MKSWEQAFAALGQQHSQQQRIRAKNIQTRMLAGGCILLHFPKRPPRNGD